MESVRIRSQKKKTSITSTHKRYRVLFFFQCIKMYILLWFSGFQPGTIEYGAKINKPRKSYCFVCTRSNRLTISQESSYENKKKRLKTTVIVNTLNLKKIVCLPYAVNGIILKKQHNCTDFKRFKLCRIRTINKKKSSDYSSRGLFTVFDLQKYKLFVF